MRRTHLLPHFLILIAFTMAAGCSPAVLPPDAAVSAISSSRTASATAVKTATNALASTLTHTTTATTPTSTATATAVATAGITASPTVKTSPESSELLYCKLDGCIYTAQQVFLRPIPVGYNQQIESTYRYGTTVFGARELHRGVEFVNPTGTPVLAVEDGIVEHAGNDHTKTYGGLLDFYGNLIILRHDLPDRDTPVYTLYGHLSKMNVQTGDHVTRGQVIGEVGNSGSAGGSHLHFEVRAGENSKYATINPELWLEPLMNPLTNTKNGTLAIQLYHRQGSVFTLQIALQDITPSGPPRQHYYYAETYHSRVHRDPFWMENFVASDLPPGTYRVFFVRENRKYEKQIEIEPERITLVEFEIDY